MTTSHLSRLIPAAALLSLSIATASTYAQTTPATPATAPAAGAGASGNFQAHQQKELTKIAAHIQILQTLQSCVQSATDHAGVKACNATAKQSEQALHH